MSSFCGALNSTKRPLPYLFRLRSAGINVKVVGLHGQTITGAHDITLKPDIYLDEAIRLASRTACLIIPTDLSMLDSFSHDARLSRFLAAVRDCDARILVGGIETGEAGSLLPLEEVEVYATGEDVFGFAQEVANLL